MKTKNKIFLSLAAFIILSLFAILLVNSQTEPIPSGTSTPLIGSEADPATGLPKEVLPIKNAGDIITDEDKRTAYLKAEWEKILLKSETFGPIVKFLLKLDPVSNILLGMPISFSWFFFLTLVIWIAFLVIIYRVTSLFEISNKWVHILVYLVAISVITLYKYSKSIAGIIISLISLANIWWMQYVIIGLVILAIILATYFSKQIQIIWKALKEKNKKNMEQLEKDEFHKDVKLMERFRKEMSE